jgi:predicted Rossmann fold nucleotide-binding protein DprA/Smf involved in DNA uptake
MTAGDGNRSRDEDSKRFTEETSTQEVLTVLEDLGGKRVTTQEIANEINYTTQGTAKRLRDLSDYIEETNLGRGNPLLWSLKYDRNDFLDALSNDELGDLSRTDQIAEHLGCDEEVVLKWMLKLEDEDEVVSKPMGDEGWIWAKKP